MARFVLKNNYFEFNNSVQQQISGTAIGTKFAPSYACIFMDGVETAFFYSELVKPWLRYIDDIFFICLDGEKSLRSVLERLNGFHPNLRCTYEFSNKLVNFLDVEVSICERWFCYGFL